MSDTIPANMQPARPAVTPTTPGTVYAFSNGDAIVTITVPQGLNAAPAAADLSGTPAPTSGRSVMNLKIRDASRKSVTTFVSPLELRIRAYGTESTVQVYYQGSWQPIPDAWVRTPARKFDKKPAFPALGTGQDIVVLLTYWPDDPGIGTQ